MNTQRSNNAENIRANFNKLFEKSHNEMIVHRSHMLSYIFLSETEKAMEEKGWNRKKLADAIGTSASYLTQLFRGDRLLNFKTIAKIEAALDIEFTINGNKNLTKGVESDASQSSSVLHKLSPGDLTDLLNKKKKAALKKNKTASKK